MAFSISGTVYTDQGVTTMGSGRTVKVVLSTGGTDTTTTASDGTFTIAGLTGSLPVAAVYLQGNTEVGLTLTRAIGSNTNITGMVIYQDTLALQVPTGGGALSNTQINTALGNADSGVTSIASSASTSTLATASGKHLHLVGSATLTSSFTTVTVNGSLYYDGSNGSNSSVTLNLSGTGSQTLTPGTVAVQAALKINSGTYTLGGNMVTSAGAAALITIASGATLDVSASNFAVVAKTWSNSGTFTPRGGTLTLIGTSTLTDTTTFNNLAIGSSSTTAAVTLGAALNVAGNLSFGSSGTPSLDVSASNYAVTVGGNWSKTGTFTAQNGTVTLNGTNQTLSGSTTFYNLTATGGNRAITFTDGTTQTVTNALTLTGTAGHLLTLAGSSTGGWTLAVPATQTLSYLSVSYGTATGNTAAAGSTSTDGLNNTNWTFGGAATATAIKDGKSF